MIMSKIETCLPSTVYSVPVNVIRIDLTFDGTHYTTQTDCLSSSSQRFAQTFFSIYVNLTHIHAAVGSLGVFLYFLNMLDIQVSPNLSTLYNLSRAPP